MQQLTTYGPGDAITWGSVRHPADPRQDARKEFYVEILEALIWRRDIASSIAGANGISAEKLAEGISEVFATADEHELSQLKEAFVTCPTAFGELLERMVREYWQAWCREKALEHFEDMEREAEEDAAAARMESADEYSRIGEGWA